MSQPRATCEAIYINGALFAEPFTLHEPKRPYIWFIFYYLREGVSSSPVFPYTITRRKYIVTGYLNVCCPFTMCFPDESYDEIKRQLVLNPPGTQVHASESSQDNELKPKLHRQNYKPIESEYYFYNNLWNKIYRN